MNPSGGLESKGEKFGPRSFVRYCCIGILGNCILGGWFAC